MAPLTDEQAARIAALDAVLHLYRGTDQPETADALAMAEWVLDGSIAAATALEGQKHALYAQRYPTDEYPREDQ